VEARIRENRWQHSPHSVRTFISKNKAGQSKTLLLKPAMSAWKYKKSKLKMRRPEKYTMSNPFGRDLVIRMFHVNKHYGAKQALVDLSLEINQNEFVFVTGPSGAGKSTLLKLLYRGEPVSGGQIIIDGMNLGAIPDKRIPMLRRKIGIIFQDYKLIVRKTVFDNVALVLEAAGQKQGLIQKKVRSVLRIVGMEDRLDAMPPSLSGGEQQRVAVARAVVGDPTIILADEPTASLDPESARIVFELIQQFHEKGATVLIATHDLEMARRSGGRLIRLRSGRLENDTHMSDL